MQLHFAEVDGDETPFVQDESYPALTLLVTPSDATGQPLSGLGKAEFRLQDDGQTADTFSVEATANPNQPLSLLIVLDASAMMRQQLPWVRGGLLQLYQLLEQTDESAVIAYAQLADGRGVNLGEPFPQLDPTREMAFTNDEGALINLINGLNVAADAGAPLYDAVLKGVRLTAAQAHAPHRAVIVIAAGADSGSNVANAEIVRNEAQQLGIPIFAIGVGEGASGGPLSELAQNNNGRFYQAGSDGEVANALNDIVLGLKQAYRLNYTAGSVPDDAEHSLTVAVNTAAGQGEATVTYRAYEPVVPLITTVTAQVRGEAAAPLSELDAVRGAVALEPQIAARGGIAAVNYYIDDNQVASHASSAPPWGFVWETHTLTPGEPHTLVVEAVDNSTPPQVGLYEAIVLVEPCNLLCQWQQSGVFTGLLVVAAVLLIGGVGFLLYRRSRAPAAPPAHPRPQPAAYSPPPPRPRPFAPAPHPTVLESEQRPAPSAAKTEVLTRETDSVAFLIHLQDAQEYPLGATTTLGSGTNNDIVLLGSDIPARQAAIQFGRGGYELIVSDDAPPVQVNDKEVRRRRLQDGDRLQIGTERLMFRQLS